MTYKQIFEMVESVGLPCAYYQFEDGTGQEPPFICFFYGDSADLAADNQNYQKIDTLYIELYTDVKDFEKEAAVEAMLTENGLTWNKEETFIDSEQMHETIYTTEVLINA